MVTFSTLVAPSTILLPRPSLTFLARCETGYTASSWAGTYGISIRQHVRSILYPKLIGTTTGICSSSVVRSTVRAKSYHGHSVRSGAYPGSEVFAAGLPSFPPNFAGLSRPSLSFQVTKLDILSWKTNYWSRNGPPDPNSASRTSLDSRD